MFIPCNNPVPAGIWLCEKHPEIKIFAASFTTYQTIGSRICKYFKNKRSQVQCQVEIWYCWGSTMGSNIRIHGWGSFPQRPPPLFPNPLIDTISLLTGLPPLSFELLPRLSGSIWWLNGEFEENNKYSDNLDSRLETYKWVFEEENQPVADTLRHHMKT